MSEFSTRSMLDVAVSERSLSDARNKVEDEMGRSVRASVDPDVAGRNGGTGRRSIRDIYETQTELLVQIRDAIEEGSFANSGGGGTTILGGLGLGAAGTAAAGGLLSGGLTRGSLNIAESLGLTDSDVARDRRQLDTSSPMASFTDGFSDTLLNFIDPAGIGQTIAQQIIDGAPEAANRITSAFDSATSSLTSDVSEALTVIGERPQWVSTLVSFTFNRPQWLSSLLQHTLERPQWLTDLTGFRLTEPEWLSNLSNFRLSEPEWVSQLTSVLGGGGNGRGSGPPQAGARIPGSEINANVSVDGSGLQRDFERALSRALRTRDLESFIIDTISDEFGLR